MSNIRDHMINSFKLNVPYKEDVTTTLSHNYGDIIMMTETFSMQDTHTVQQQTNKNSHEKDHNTTIRGHDFLLS